MKKFLSFFAAGIITVSSAFLPFTVQASTSITFNKGVGQSWTVPAGVTSIMIDATGAAGDSNFYTGKGARVQATYAVTPGTVLYINVGGQDGTSGGGAGFSGLYTGGGHTWLSLISSYDHSSNLILDVGAGGGPGSASYIGSGYYGANAGIATGSNSNSASGGTQSAGGNGGTYGTSGSSGIGGNGGVGSGNAGGGGGAGYFGGGGGSGVAGDGGGGGSSFLSSSLTSTSTAVGYQSGDGYLTITYTASTHKHKVILISLNWKPEPIA
jgi:hypothetical protein